MLRDVTCYLLNYFFLQKYHSSVKVAYKAFDTSYGIEVAWTKIGITSKDQTEQDKVLKSAKLLEDIKHKHVIECHSTWLQPEPETRILNIITTHFTNLKE